MRKKTLLFTFIFLLVSCGLYFAYFKVKDILSRGEGMFHAASLNEPGPSMTIKGFRLQETRGDRLEWVLAAQEALMFRDKGQILFNVVDTQVLGDGKKKENYNISSDKGTYYTKEDKMNFNGNVGVKTSGGYEFYTDNVDYMAKTKTLDTDSVVKMNGMTQKGEKMHVEGVGLDGNADSGDFKILSDVVTRMGENLEVKSEEAVMNTRDSKVVFIRKISAKKGNIRIKGDRLEAGYANTGDVSDIDVAGNVKLIVDKKVALCDNAVIKGNSNEVVLTGKPELHMGDDIMVGEKIVFFTDSDEVFVERVKADVSQRGYKK